MRQFKGKTAVITGAGGGVENLLTLSRADVQP